MALYGNKREGHWILSLKGQSLVLLHKQTVPSIHLSDFTYIL